MLLMNGKVNSINLMKILFITNSFGTGGAERQIVSLSEELIQRGHQVKLVTLKCKPNDLLCDMKNIEHSSLKMSSIKGYVSALFKYRDIIANFKPDVVHSHLPHSIIFSRIAKLLLRSSVKLVCTTHNYNVRSKLFAKLYRYTDFISDYNTNVSQAAVNRYIEERLYKSQNSCYVPNGFNVKKFIGNNNGRDILKKFNISDSDIVCIAMGRLHYQKNYPMMLFAMKKVVEEDAKIKLIILGDGPDKVKLERQCSKLGLERNVFFVGLVDNVSEYLSASDLYLMSSVFEGMPLAICEAMLSYLPMVVTDFNGVEEFVFDYYPIVKQNDHSDFADKILYLSKKDCTREIKLARENIIDNYSIERVVDKWMSIYEF